MSDINLYTLSNKIRTILLTAIDKELLTSSKKNNLLINSQNQEQLTKKFINYQDFIIESEELFEEVKCNEDNNIFYDLRCNYFDNKYSFFCNSTRTSNNCLALQNLNTKSIFKKNNNVNSQMKETKDSRMSENNLFNVKVDSGKKIIEKTKSSLSCNKKKNFKNSKSLKSSSQKHIKKYSADYIFSGDSKNNDSLALINYCYELKKPNVEIINEISEDDSSTNKETKKNLLFSHRIKKTFRNIQKKKLKKTINKKKSANNISYKNDDERFIHHVRRKTTNFTNEMNLFFDKIEKSNQKDKIKIPHINKKLSNYRLKDTESFCEKNISQFHGHNNESSKKNLKGKKLELVKKIFSIRAINKRHAHRNSQDLSIYYKSIDNNPIILKHKENKDKGEKNDASIAVNVLDNIEYKKKYYNSSRIVCKKNNKLQQNEMFCFGKKILTNYLNKRNRTNKNERKNINISNFNYYNKIIHKSDSKENNQNLQKFESSKNMTMEKLN